MFTEKKKTWLVNTIDILYMYQKEMGGTLTSGATILHHWENMSSNPSDAKLSMILRCTEHNWPRSLS